MNVITCDWSNGSQSINYPQVAANTRVVGAEIARQVERKFIILNQDNIIMFKIKI